jgi:hypothetical protein
MESENVSARLCSSRDSLALRYHISALKHGERECVSKAVLQQRLLLAHSMESETVSARRARLSNPPPSPACPARRVGPGWRPVPEAPGRRRGCGEPRPRRGLRQRPAWVRRGGGGERVSARLDSIADKWPPWRTAVRREHGGAERGRWEEKTIRRSAGGGRASGTDDH